MRCIFEHDSFGQFPLERAAVFFEFRENSRFLIRFSDHTHENVTLPEICGDVDRMECDQCLSAEINFA